MELGEFSADEGVAGKVAHNKGWRGIGVDARRGDVRGEVGADTLLEMVVFEVMGAEFSPVYCFLVALLILVDEVEVGLDCDMCPMVAF